jgi:hypothetical protein
MCVLDWCKLWINGDNKGHGQLTYDVSLMLLLLTFAYIIHESAIWQLRTWAIVDPIKTVFDYFVICFSACIIYSLFVAVCAC